MLDVDPLVEEDVITTPLLRGERRLMDADPLAEVDVVRRMLDLTLTPPLRCDSSPRLGLS